MTEIPAAPEPSPHDRFREGLRALDSSRAEELREELAFPSPELTETELSVLEAAFGPLTLRLTHHPSTARTEEVTPSVDEDSDDPQVYGGFVGYLESEVVAQIQSYEVPRPVRQPDAQAENVLADAEPWSAGGNDTAVDTVTEQIRLVRRFGGPSPRSTP